MQRIILDFDLGKNDQGNEIIVRVKERFSTQWKKFKEADRALDYHRRLKLLPPSKSYVSRDKVLKKKFSIIIMIPILTN